MLEELMNLVKEATGNAVNNAPDVSNEHSDAIAQEATHSIMDELKGAISGGGLSNVVNMLRGNETDVAGNPTTQNMLGNLTSKLTEKFGLSQDAAQSLGSSIIPSVMSKLTGKINDPNDNSLNLDSAIGSLTGGKLSNITSMLDKNGDGKVDLSDAMSLLGGSNNTSKGGGIMGKLKGLFGG